MPKSKKPSAPKNITEKRLIAFEKFLDAAFDGSRDFVKQKLAFSTLGISFLLALKEISENSNEDFSMPILWFLGNIFFILTIFITLYENKRKIKYNSEAVSYYYKYDNPKEKNAKIAEKLLYKSYNFLVKVEWCADFCFLFGIICAIVFTWLN